MFAAYRDTPYNVVLLLHIVSVIMGVGAAFLGPAITARSRSSNANTDLIDELIQSVMAPALFAAGVFGGALVGMSNDVLDFQQTWLVIAGPLWIVAVAAAVFVAPPSYVRVHQVFGQRMAALGGVLHLCIAIELVIMIWQPGL